MRHDPANVLLYRPVHQAELDLVAATDWLAFPEQPPEPTVFYLTAPEAIAAPAGAGPGYLLRLAMDADYIARLEEAPATGRMSSAGLPVPVAELAEFNRHITGRIEVAGLW